jgi:sugar diacid utilization regulator
MAYVHMLVQRALEPEMMLRGYRVAHASLWRHCAREAFTRFDDAAMLPLVLEHASDLVFDYTNNCIEGVAEEFELARQAHQRWPVAQRLEAVVRLLEGHESPPSELANLLQYDVTREHVGLIVRANAGLEGEKPASVPPNGLATRIAKSLAPTARPLVLPAGCDTVWMWVASPPETDEQFAAAIAGVAHEAGVTVGLGESGAGLEGFRETHLQAREAVDCAAALAKPVARYAEVALTSTLHGDPKRALRLMHFALGHLVAEEPKNDRLRETVRAFIDSGCSVRATARDLGTHPHTITYRLRQAEPLLGHAIVEHAALISSGLLVHDMLKGSSTLPDTALRG